MELGYYIGKQYIKFRLKEVKVDEGRMVRIQAFINGAKILCNIFTLIKGDPNLLIS